MSSSTQSGQFLVTEKSASHSTRPRYFYCPSPDFTSKSADCRADTRRHFNCLSVGNKQSLYPLTWAAQEKSGGTSKTFRQAPALCCPLGNCFRRHCPTYWHNMLLSCYWCYCSKYTGDVACLVETKRRTCWSLWRWSQNKVHRQTWQSSRHFSSLCWCCCCCLSVSDDQKLASTLLNLHVKHSAIYRQLTWLVVSEVRSSSFGLQLHAQHIFLQILLISRHLRVTVTGYNSPFQVHVLCIRYDTVLADTAVLCMHVTSCAVAGTWRPPDECYCNTLLYNTAYLLFHWICAKNI